MRHMPPVADQDLPIVQFADAAAWEAWLRSNGSASGAVWLKLAKKGAPGRTVSYAQALDVALCHGWIDGHKRALDEHFWLQRFSRRGPRSRWSKVNTEKASKLIEAGLMAPAGMAEVQAAKRDGRWEDAYEPQSRAAPTEDFAAALDAVPAARAFFDSLRSAQRYAFLYRLRNIKRRETRAERIAEYVRMLAERRTLHD
jgi:uncharacterized protein YdeI (YjbR/CyaY-like superfamily)